MNIFEGKIIFLTGGTGFFGKWLLRCLPASARITVLSRHPENFTRRHPEFSRFNYLGGDVRNFRLPDSHFDYIIHGAATSGDTVPDAETESVILGGTARILKMNFDKLLYISSGAIYGPNPPEHVTEDYRNAPATPYGCSKLAAERLCLNSGKAAVIARCFAFVGPYLPLDAHFAIGNFINDCLLRRPIVIKGDGLPRRSYLYAQDLAEWLLKILSAGRPGRAYNVGSDQSVSIRELAQLVMEVCGNAAPPEVMTPSTAATGPAYVPDISRARNELGLTIRTSLPAAIRRTFEFHAAGS